MDFINLVHRMAVPCGMPRPAGFPDQMILESARAKGIAQTFAFDQSLARADPAVLMKSAAIRMMVMIQFLARQLPEGARELITFKF